ncbi:MAG: sigma-70 family RNA polymerase sigma factor [Pseudomonadota bacterium]
MQNLTDEQLVVEVKGGSRNAFNELVRRYQDRIWRMVHKYVFDAEEAKEATQEVFLRVYRGISTFRGDSKFYTWIYRLAINTSQEFRRKGYKEGVKRNNFKVHGDIQGDNVEQHKGVSGLEAAQLVDELPEKQKRVVLLRIYEGLSVAETAEVLNTSEGTVKSNLFKALATLRRKFVNEEA